jgi:cytoskeleton-associated protein 5
VKKFVVDSNEVAKDKALEAVLAFIENIPAAAKSVGEVMPGIISKCLSSRPKTKEKAFEIILMYIEAEKHEIVLEELIKGLDNKQPKVVVACLEILRTAINQFGSKTMPIKPVIKIMTKLLEDRDKNIREEARLTIVEMYRWAGNAIVPQIQGIKPILLAELEEEFKKVEGKPKQTRFLRSQQELKAKHEAEIEEKEMNGNDQNSDTNGEEGVDEAMDPYDLMEPFDLKAKIPSDFKEKLVNNNK